MTQHEHDLPAAPVPAGRDLPTTICPSKYFWNEHSECQVGARRNLQVEGHVPCSLDPNKNSAMAIQQGRQSLNNHAGTNRHAHARE
jgi:hypothetical protein